MISQKKNNCVYDAPFLSSTNRLMTLIKSACISDIDDRLFLNWNERLFQIILSKDLPAYFPTARKIRNCSHQARSHRYNSGWTYLLCRRKIPFKTTTVHICAPHGSVYSGFVFLLLLFFSETKATIRKPRVGFPVVFLLVVNRFSLFFTSIGQFAFPLPPPVASPLSSGGHTVTVVFLWFK